jgi:phage repressor protein C with HTH and peptisase S24 domain
MSATAIANTQFGRYSIVQGELPGQGVVSLGVLLQDANTRSLYLRFRRDMDLLAEEEDLEILTGLADDLAGKAREMGSEELFAYLEDALSGSLRISDRETILVDDFSRTVERLYRQHVQSNVVPFKTHLPRYSLRAAAGKFLDNEEVVEQNWLEVPPDIRHLDRGMFIAEIAGHSMEPLIPDASLCIFRAPVVGSRTGRLILAEDRQANAYAVKRYQSEKTATEEGWKHRHIRLESLNPDYPSWNLEPDEEKYRIVAEFVRVLD